MTTPALSAPAVERFENPKFYGQSPLKRPPRPEPGAVSSAYDRRLQELHDRVESSLANSGYAALAVIRCDVDQNRVILRGSVPSYHLKQLAQVYAQRVEGIGGIDNRLEVRKRVRC